MKSVGLITLHRVNNFGSVFQTYATIKKIEEAGGSCTLIDYLYPARFHLVNQVLINDDKTKKKSLKYYIKCIMCNLHLLVFINRLRRFFDDFILKKPGLETLRNDLFAPFRENFLKQYYTPICYDRKSIHRHPPVFDVYVTGSDQTWNPLYLSSDYSFLLNFAPCNKKKISFSASFGATQLLPQYVKAYQKWLSQYDSISVRESSGIEIVKALTGKDAVWLMDPTLLLRMEEWQQIADYTRVPQGRFVFCYMMDYVFDPFSTLYALLEKLKLPSDCKIYVWCEYGHYKEVLNRGFNILEKMRPEDFLAMFDRATYIITNSFHGTAFSINFNKDFTVILNPNATKDSRVAELLKNFGLQKRGIRNPDEIEYSQENLKTDFSEANSKLKEMRKKSMTFLRNALNDRENA